MKKCHCTPPKSMKDRLFEFFMMLQTMLDMTAPSEQKTDCDHFSIRGYVAGIRTKNPKAGNLFGENFRTIWEELRGELNTSCFRWWGCVNCVLNLIENNLPEQKNSYPPSHGDRTTAAHRVVREEIAENANRKPKRAREVSGTQPRVVRHRGESSGRSTIARDIDDFLMQAVDRCVKYVSEHRDEFSLSPQTVNRLAQGILRGVSELPLDHPLHKLVDEQLRSLMVSIIGNIFKTEGPGKDKGKAPAEDVNYDSDSSNDGDDARLQNYPSAPAGGPIILG